MATASYYNKGSDEYIDAKCSLCADKNKDQIADHYCYDCQKHLCKTCLGTHNSLIENHIVVQGDGDDNVEFTEKCGVHEEELINIYCLQHNKLICIQCRRQDHRTCKDVKHIKETAHQLSADTDLQAVPAQLHSSLDNIQKAIESLDNVVAYIQNKGSGFLKDLELYAKKLLSRIREMRDKGKRVIKCKQGQLISDAERYRHGCVLAKNEVNRCLDTLTKTNQLKVNLFILNMKAKQITKSVDVLFNESNNFLERHQFNFMADIKIIDSFNGFNSLVAEVSTTVPDSLGAVEGAVDRPTHATLRRSGDRRLERPVGKRGNVTEETQENRGDRPVESLGEKLSREKAPSKSIQVGNINVRIPGDKVKCAIFGCCRLSDACLVIADYNNRRLKRVDPSTGTVTKYCDTEKQPRDVCWNGPREVVAAFGSTKIHVYSAVSLSQTRTIELNHITTKIACHGGILYAGSGSGKTLYVHDLRDGKKLREICQDTDGQDIFSYIKGISLNGPGDRLFVADEKRGLVCFNKVRQLIFSLSLEDLGLSGARGVVTDHCSRVFLCGRLSHNVVEVTEDGHVVGQILSRKDGIVSPLSLGYDVDRSRLYVGRISDQLLAFELM